MPKNLKRALNNKVTSPFTPGSPVPYELFVGRKKKIKEIIRYVDQSLAGKQENVFLSGDRGIGKSSMASFLRYYVSTQRNILGIHAFLGGVSTVEEMVRYIFDQLLKETKGQPSFNSISTLFGKHIKEVGLFGISLSFNPPEKNLRELVRNFPEAIYNLLKKIKAQRSGLFIVLDDINGLVEKEEFANWYKSFVDEVATHYQDFPVFIMLIGLPEMRDVMARLQPSLMRIFRVEDIEKLSDNEVKSFLSKAFKKVNIEIKVKAMEYLVTYTSGLPLFMHEIGDATFWSDDDGIIDEIDAIDGILEAAEKIGAKYLDPKVYRAIRSPHYRSILRKLCEVKISTYFKKKDVEKDLNSNEKRVFSNFLRRMKELGVIETDREQSLGSYRFVNMIYPIYIRMESRRAEKVKKR